MIRLALCALLLTGCATLEQRATTAAVADGGTTLAGLALGAAEANPLGLAAIALKWPVMEYAKTLPESEQAQFYEVAGAIWGGATVNNLCVIAGLLTGGTAGAACIAAGVGYALYALRTPEPEAVERPYAFGDEVAFWQACADYKRKSGEAVRCVYRLSVRDSLAYSA